MQIMKIIHVSLISTILFFTAIHPVNAACNPSNTPPGDPYIYGCSDNGVQYWCSVSSSECVNATDGSGSSGSLPRFSDVADSFIQSIGLKPDLTSISGIINLLIPLAMTLAGLILFLMLIAGGFQMLTSASDPKAADAGKQRITTALIGFLIVFASYWIVQILEVVLGVNILG